MDEIIVDQDDPRLSDLWQPNDPAAHSNLLHISLCKALYEVTALRARLVEVKEENRRMGEAVSKAVGAQRWAPCDKSVFKYGKEYMSFGMKHNAHGRYVKYAVLVELRRRHPGRKS